MDVDYELVQGDIVGSAVSRDSGASTIITLTAGEEGATIVGMALTAHPAPVLRSYRVRASDDDSIGDFGRRGLPSGAEPAWAGRWDATDIVTAAVRDRARPLTRLRVRID